MAALEGKIADLEQEKMHQFNEHQGEMDSQKKILELQVGEAKKRVQELTEKCEGYKVKLQAEVSKGAKAAPTNNDEVQALRDQLMQKEEENYSIILKLKEDNSRLSK